MSASNVHLPPLIIPAGASVSNILNGPGCYDDALAIVLYTPAGLEAHTYTLQVCPDGEATPASTFVTLQVGDTPADQGPPAAGKSQVYYELASAMSFRIKSNANVTDAQTFEASKSIDI